MAYRAPNSLPEGSLARLAFFLREDGVSRILARLMWLPLAVLALRLAVLFHLPLPPQAVEALAWADARVLTLAADLTRPAATPAPAAAPAPAPARPTVADDPALRRIQDLLNRLGFDAGPADGRIGPKTRDAATQFALMVGEAGLSGEALLARLEDAAADRVKLPYVTDHALIGPAFRNTTRAALTRQDLDDATQAFAMAADSIGQTIRWINGPHSGSITVHSRIADPAGQNRPCVTADITIAVTPGLAETARDQKACAIGRLWILMK